MTEDVIAAHLALAEALADAAGPIIRSYFRRKIAVDDKPDATPVTIADRESEAAMRALIEDRFPEHGIIGEEHGRTRADAEYVWVLDPIDGTKSFISGIPLFGTLIALVHCGRPVIGVIDQPVLRERWVGATGRATMLNGTPVRTRPCPALAQATLFCTAPHAMFTGADAAAFARLSGAVKLLRTGADCYAYALIASGFIDLVVEAGLKPYDYAALVPVIEGAGGVLTDWQGHALDLGSDGRVIAAGDPGLAAAAGARLAGVG
ncbi:MAG TPA: histidinol-phosphatase [Stellaceae bacterium]|jgi:inositol-phosphate phosphatase/L-galactose 1-phosphate phosphatase/histidinol-phosphatase|nr:histidinol-phosphatase [Stellaceae bacterium]